MSKPVLFLDRDGVINRRPVGDYVRTPDTFIPETGLEEAAALMARHFSRIFVVTNQAGVGKGLMTEDDLQRIHEKMLDIFREAGGRIDGVYYCPHRSDAGCTCRKPATGLAFQAQRDFPDIDFRRAWMVGDSASDMEMGRRLGMKTVLILGKTEEIEQLAAMPLDYRFGSLLAFARAVAGSAFADDEESVADGQ